MKKLIRLSACFDIFRSARPGVVQAIIISLLMMPGGFVQAGDKRMAQEIKLHLGAVPPQRARNNLSATPPAGNLSAPAPVDNSNSVTILSQKRTQSSPPRQRNPEISAQHLIIVGLNAQGQETSRTIMLDPRILRAEAAESSGKRIPTEIMYREDVSFSITIPDDSNAVTLQIYKPRWTGKEFALDLIGQVNLQGAGNE